MKKDIADQADVERLIEAFYRRIWADKLLGPVFLDVVQIDWEKHLPLMHNFWCNILFYTEQYAGNPMELHGHLGRITPLSKQHFKRWVSLFSASVDELFEGEKAELAKQKARRIAAVLQEQVLGKTGK